jgi:hypothetical protein
MDNLTAWVGFLAGLSVATERITEIIKGLIAKLAVELDGEDEERRKALVQIIAVLVGSALSFAVYGQIQATFHLPSDFWPKLGICFVLGTMASGGSGLWNSVLDIVREVNRQKQVLTEKLKIPAPAATAPTTQRQTR